VPAGPRSPNPPANPLASGSGAAPTVPTASSDGSNLQSIPPADIKLQTYNVPDGWTCTSQTIGNGVVNALNEADPGRYVQVPLRDGVGP
jgi:hypothetical protein